MHADLSLGGGCRGPILRSPGGVCQTRRLTYTKQPPENLGRCTGLLVVDAHGGPPGRRAFHADVLARQPRHSIGMRAHFAAAGTGDAPSTSAWSVDRI